MATISIIRQVREFPFITVEGQSGQSYQFNWVDQLQAYAFETDDAKVIEDIALTQGPNSFFYFTFRGKVGREANPKILPPSYYNELSRDELAALAKDVGLKPESKDNSTTLKRLLDAYFIGLGSK